MEIIKFKEEIETLKKFFEIYCANKHENQEEKVFNLVYKNENISIKVNLCKECQDSINYSFDRLLDCPHEIKPRCRKCPNPCYEKNEWKKTAKVMRYSGIKLGLSKIKNFLKK